jgi:hypothetical protein
MIVEAPYFVPNTVIRRDLQTPKVKEKIRRYSSQYSARLSTRQNDLVEKLMAQPDKNQEMADTYQNDSPTRFVV